MTDSPDRMPTYAELAADPETAALLGFEPVVRKVKVEGGWTGELQRELIARLAVHGSASKACDEMGKNRTGVSKLYRSPSAASFRAAWDAAVELATRRRAEQAPRAEYVSSNTKPPTIDHRRKFERPPAGPEGACDGQADPGPEDSEADDAALRMELVEKLIAKFQRKVAQERGARLGGRIVEADFLLRQITVLEVAFDLMIDGQADRGWSMLMEARRGTRNLLEIADTYMARVLDQARRDQWAAMAEPGRPEVWPERYLLGKASGDVRTEPLESAGKASRPPAGVERGQWMRMDTEEQTRIYAEQHRRDAEALVAWEADAAAQASEWRARQSTADKTNDGD